MDEPLPLDVSDRLTHDFGDRAGAVAASLVARRRIGSADFVCDRVMRCIVHAASGDERRIPELLELARQDFRDVIVAAEYDATMRRVRDLRASFLIDSPEKFWASEVACLMADRGYRLTVLETHPATGRFDYGSDHAEGRATFTGPIGEIAIEKTARQWVVHCNRADVAAHRIDHTFNDEAAFRDALSSYLLSNVPAGDGLTNA